MQFFSHRRALSRGVTVHRTATRRPSIEPLEERRLMAASVPRFDHIVVVVEENHALVNIIGSTSAPYINSLATGGALFTQSYGITHPSQPNYLALFSGSTQGTTSDTPPTAPYTTANLGAELLSAHDTFTGYSESLPSVGYLGTSYSTVSGQNQYERKHNPWSDWQSASPTGNLLPSSVNQPLTALPTDFTKLPTVSFVVPNEQNDMHDGTVAAGDSWLKAHLSAYATWAKTHNSLLIVTWDEDDSGHGNLIPTIFSGARVKPGSYGETINHYSVLRTIENSDALLDAGNSATATPITDCWTTPSRKVSLTSAFNLVGISADSNPKTGNLDTLGNSYSGTALGTSLTYGGNSYTFGTAGVNDSVKAIGQTLTLPQGNFSALTLLGTSTNGAKSGTFLVTYTDGTTASFTQTFDDWLNNTGVAGESVARKMTYRNTPTGSKTVTTYLYAYTFKLNPAKVVASIKLPNLSNVKILAMDELD